MLRDGICTLVAELCCPKAERSNSNVQDKERRPAARPLVGKSIGLAYVLSDANLAMNHPHGSIPVQG